MCRVRLDKRLVGEEHLQNELKTMKWDTYLVRYRQVNTAQSKTRKYPSLFVLSFVRKARFNGQFVRLLFLRVRWAVQRLQPTIPARYRSTISGVSNPFNSGIICLEGLLVKTTWYRSRSILLSFYKALLCSIYRGSGDTKRS